jgi:HAD superfamily hydrolase (TIGR01509 family)
MTDFRAGTSAVIFDLDGVIVDSEPLHQLSFRQLFDELGVEPKGIDDWQRFIGTSDRQGLIEMLDGRQVDHSLDALLERKGELFLDLLREQAPLYPEIPDLVATLDEHYRLAVASGSLRSAIAGALELNGLRRHFKATVSVQDVPRGKPAPDLFLRAAELINEVPSACVAIEDSVAGVTAAKAASMRVIAVTNTSPAERLAHADAVVGSYAKVRELLLPV